MPIPFTKTELDFLKRHLEIQFGEPPKIRDGLVLKTWKSGELKGRPKLSAPLQSLVDRSLLAVVAHGGRLPVAVFTEAGIAALTHAVGDTQVFPSGRFDHLRIQLDKT